MDTQLPGDAWHCWVVSVGDVDVDLWGAGPCHAHVYLARTLPGGNWSRGRRPHEAVAKAARIPVDVALAAFQGTLGSQHDAEADSHRGDV